jgi:hypothetical protein
VWLWVAIGLGVVVAAVALLLMTSGREARAAEGADPTVPRSPTCGCCAAWVEHLEANGFRVIMREHDGLGPITAARGIPDGLRSCHTGLRHRPQIT